MSNRSRLILLALVIGLVGYLLSVFKFVKVADVSWDRNYAFESREPYGGYAFLEMVKAYYGPERVHFASDTTTFAVDTVAECILYIALNAYSNYHTPLDSFLTFVSQGNDALLIGSEQTYELDSIFASAIYGDLYDTTVWVKVGDMDYGFLNYREDYLYPRDQYFGTFQVIPLDSIAAVTGISYELHHKLHDGQYAMISRPYQSGQIYLHVIPELYSNAAFNQASMQGYIEATLSMYTPDYVIIDQVNLHDPAPEQHAGQLDYVLSQPSLRWAYYLALMSMFVFLIFRSKRKQQVIPIIPVNSNTSMAYVDTLSHLYQSQQQPTKLISHLEEVWWHWVKKKYYITADMPNAISTLSRKCHVAEQEITNIIKRFSSAKDNPLFQNDQLIRFHQQLEDFYKKCK